MNRIKPYLSYGIIVVAILVGLSQARADAPRPTPEQRAEMKAKWDAMTPAEKEAKKAEMKATWDALPEAEKQERRAKAKEKLAQMNDEEKAEWMEKFGYRLSE